MCRFTLYLGPPVRLAALLTEPSHSLIRQSFQASEREEPLNGDGFGVGWYSPRLTAQPAVLHSITPAWNNHNLRSIAGAVASPCVLAHVRAASPGSDVHEANCHPFTHGRYLFMHNGQIGSFQRMRRQLREGLGDEAYHLIRGTTDTEHLFATFVDELRREGSGEVDPEPDGGRGAVALAEALARAIARVTALVREVGGASSSLNVAVSDGHRAAVSRFSDRADVAPESLYILKDELYEPAGRHFRPSRAGDEGPSVVVSSERLTDDDEWREVPRNSLVMFDRWTEPRTVHLSTEGVGDFSEIRSA
jgi:predicted glutamine amidotransferase